MEVTYSDYWRQINSIAEDVIDECKHDDLDEIDSDALSDHLHEVIDGHHWIIYYAYNNAVLNYCSNEDAWEDCYCAEDIGQLVIDQGMRGARAVQAYFAMLEDVNTAIHQLVEDRCLEMT